MSETYNLKTVTSQLAAFGLKKFLKEAKHKKELQNRTMCQNQLGTALGFDYNIISIYMAPPDEFTRNSKMYQDILKYLKESDSGKFLEALEDSNNEHIIEYIKDELDKSWKAEVKESTTVTDGNPSGSSSSSSTPLPCSLERKVELLKQHLKGGDLGNFLKDNLSFLCLRTTNLSVFVLHLIELDLVSETDAEAWSQLPNVERCKKLYQEAGKTGYGDKLVQALKLSANKHIIEEMYTWIPVPPITDRGSSPIII